MPGKKLAGILIISILLLIPVIPGCGGDGKCLIMEKACEISSENDPGGACGMAWGTHLDSFQGLARHDDMELPGQMKAYSSQDRPDVTCIFNAGGEYIAALVIYDESMDIVLECLQEKLGKTERQDFEGHGLYAWSGTSTSFVLTENSQDGGSHPMLFLLSVELARELPEFLGIAY
ncbi:MAG: hypothetical protein JW971_10620 [Synergistales bacterium]|nr:hypothetical protein [Synergistales bacterium]